MLNTTTATLLTTLGLFTATSLTHAAEGDPPTAPDTDQVTAEDLETEDAWIELELPEDPQADQGVEVEIGSTPAVETIEIEPVEDINPDDQAQLILEPTTDPIDAQPITEPRVISMDRSDWPTLVVSPIDGQVPHHPHFTGEAPLGEDIVTPLHAPDPVWQLQEALAGAHAGNLNGENLSHLGAQPVVGLTQFVLMPARMILENPWSKATSPDSE